MKHIIDLRLELADKVPKAKLKAWLEERLVADGVAIEWTNKDFRNERTEIQRARVRRIVSYK